MPLIPILLAFAQLATSGESEATARIWVDWGEASAQSVSAELAQLQAERTKAERPPTEQAQALGKRVGEIVAAGDCAEGERVARAAGDMGLARAVRDYCYK